MEIFAEGSLLVFLKMWSYFEVTGMKLNNPEGNNLALLFTLCNSDVPRRLDTTRI